MLSREIQEEIVTFTQELIRVYSLSGQEARVAQIIEQKMRALAYDSVQTDAFGNVIGQRKGSHPGPTVLFDAHMDVVPVTNPEAWSSAPFAAELRAGKIWGRGASDMKGPLAAALVALGRVPAEAFGGVLVVSCTVGEEIHEGLALAHVMEAIRPDFVVICEPNGCCLGIGQKGRAGLRVEVRGKPAHSSVPHLGENAIYKAAEVIARLRAMPLPKDPLLGEGILELIDGISSPYPSQSTVPVCFTMRYDRRLMQGETMESVQASLREALIGLADWTAEFPEVEIHTYTGKLLEGPDFHPGWVIARDSPWIVKAARGLSAAGIALEYTTARFCTNGSYSAGTAGVPTMIFGPSSGLLAHCIDEHIAVSELLQGAEGYTGLARELTGS
jgi:putative selenium metabolism hydrolase